MGMICVPVPNLEANETVAIEVSIGGRKQAMNYRVETVAWQDSDGVEDQIELLRHFIRAHDPEWQLVQIGPPDSGVVAVTFRQLLPVEDANRESPLS